MGLKEDSKTSEISIELIRKSLFFDDFAFVEKARATDTTRYAIECILIDSGCIVATDGRRMHIAYINTYPFVHGLYKVLIANKKRILLLLNVDNGPFPLNYAALIPNHNNFFHVDADNITKIPLIYNGLSKEDIFINVKYLQDIDMTSFDVFFEKKKVGEKRNETFIVIRQDNRQAVIGPLLKIDPVKFETTEKEKIKTIPKKL